TRGAWHGCLTFFERLRTITYTAMNWRGCITKWRSCRSRKDYCPMRLRFTKQPENRAPELKHHLASDALRPTLDLAWCGWSADISAVRLIISRARCESRHDLERAA